jgi:ComF family protein
MHASPASHLVTSVLDALLAVVVAPTCAACGEPLEHPMRGAACERCWQSILPITPPICDTCGDSLATWRTSAAFPRCARCQLLDPIVVRARAVGTYDGSLRAIIHALKYDGRRSVAPRLSTLMRHHGSEILADASAVVPVPLHASRRRQRGFNQAIDLAKGLQLPVVLALRRVRATSVQASLPAARRHANVRKAFAATRAAARLVGHTIVLVDDVSTTGATLEACARALREAGVGEVRALTAARVVSSQP